MVRHTVQRWYGTSSNQTRGLGHRRPAAEQSQAVGPHDIGRSGEVRGAPEATGYELLRVVHHPQISSIMRAGARHIGETEEALADQVETITCQVILARSPSPRPSQASEHIQALIRLTLSSRIPPIPPQSGSPATARWCPC